MYEELINRRNLGPLDISEVSIRENLIDFGALKLPNRHPDLVIKVEMEEDSRKLVALTLETQDSMLQVSLFSAPKSTEVWPEAVEVLRESLQGQGAQVHDAVGVFGLELNVVAQLSQETGEPSAHHIRFIGVDGPRWLLRGSVTGAALFDAEAAAVVERIFRSVIVDRGDDPMPPRELIGLTMPAGNVAPPMRPQ
jgi:hypothetical protein